MRSSLKRTRYSNRTLTHLSVCKSKTKRKQSAASAGGAGWLILLYARFGLTMLVCVYVVCLFSNVFLSFYHIFRRTR